ncbi:hypothetical protein ACFL3H_00635 [Gemmatimonadota bacterium]
MKGVRNTHIKTPRPIVSPGAFIVPASTAVSRRPVARHVTDVRTESDAVLGREGAATVVA